MSQTLNAAIAVVGIDIGKNSFHIVGHNERGAFVLRQKWSRGQVEARFANLPPCLIGMEACVGAHHLSRKLRALGHYARLMAVVGDDGGLHAELVRRGGLAFADALHLRGMEGIKLPAALALLLRADLRGPAKREGERLLQCWLSLDLAADVADDPAQPAAQDTQLPLMPPELFGMGVAARHHRGGLGHARIGLPQPDAVPSSPGG